jgi:hypothetical protein
MEERNEGLGISRKAKGGWCKGWGREWPRWVQRWRGRVQGQGRSRNEWERRMLRKEGMSRKEGWVPRKEGRKGGCQGRKE